MIVKWKLNSKEVQEAVVFWLQEKKGIIAGEAKVQVYYSTAEGNIAEVTGTVDSVSLGPYR